MKTQNEIEYRHFSITEGHLVPRYGSKGSYIGATLTHSGQDAAKSMAGPTAEGSFKWKFDPEKIVRIPETSFIYYLREYNRAIKNGSLKVRTKEEYDKYIKALQKNEQKGTTEEVEKSPVQNKEKSK